MNNVTSMTKTKVIKNALIETMITIEDNRYDSEKNIFLIIKIERGVKNNLDKEKGEVYSKPIEVKLFCNTGLSPEEDVGTCVLCDCVFGVGTSVYCGVFICDTVLDPTDDKGRELLVEYKFV